MFWQADFFFLLYQNLNKQSCSNMLKTLPWKKINWNQQAHTHINCQSLHDCGNEIQVALKRKKIIWSVKNVYFNLLPTPKMRSWSNLKCDGDRGVGVGGYSWSEWMEQGIWSAIFTIIQCYGHAYISSSRDFLWFYFKDGDNYKYKLLFKNRLTNECFLENQNRRNTQQHAKQMPVD